MIRRSSNGVGAVQRVSADKGLSSLQVCFVGVMRGGWHFGGPTSWHIWPTFSQFDPIDRRTLRWVGRLHVGSWAKSDVGSRATSHCAYPQARLMHTLVDLQVKEACAQFASPFVATPLLIRSAESGV